MRGALLIIVAVLLGAGLLANGFRNDDNGASTGTTPTTKPTNTTTPTSAVAQPHDPAQV
jgi:hypothetical protein